MTHDLVFKGGRVIDPANGFDGLADVAVTAGRVAAVGPGLTGQQMVDVTGRIVTPGLIDLHTHVYRGGTSLALDPISITRMSGATTLVDAGSAGASNFAGFRDHVIAPGPMRIFAFLNISYAGIFAWKPGLMFGEASDLRLLDMAECLRVVRENPNTIVGVKVRLGSYASGASGIAPLDMALEVAAEAGVPVMAHIDYVPPTGREVLDRLRPGDVLTHTNKGFPNSLLRPDGQILPAALTARERGVLFDIGHGTISYDHDVARRMADLGFVADFISSDLHAMCVDGENFHLLTVMSKLLAIGLPLPEVIARTTARPAAFLRRDDLGTLRPGALADVTVLDHDGPGLRLVGCWIGGQRFGG